ncbi:MAG: serine/threonine protein kinase [Chloroflexaceae bacterium]|nr:serine/threonine protein kinase [Chloroflexaceae bacterium]
MLVQALTCYYCNTPTPPDQRSCAVCGNILILQERYQIVCVLGQGGFGVVYEALDVRLNRRCAIKRVTATSLAEQQLIQNEADILARHASNFGFMPTIYDVWVEQAQTYMVMEYIDGPSLDQTTLPWHPAQVREFLIEMLVNLSRLHAVHIIHRDIKPQNIKYTPQGRHIYMLLDFGLARQGTAMSVKAMSPDYAPPEQVQGLPTDARSDLYSLAATAYHMLTGQAPLQARIQAGGYLPPPHQFSHATPPALEHALLKMLEPEPDKRPLHARAALALLDREPPTTGPTIHIQPMGYQATPTIPVNRSRRTAHPYKLPIPPYQPQRTHHRTDEHELFDSMNELAETFQDSPQAVGRIDPTLRPPQLWQIEYSKLKFGSKRKAGLLGQLMSMFTLFIGSIFLASVFMLPLAIALVNENVAFFLTLLFICLIVYAMLTRRSKSPDK